MFVDESINNVNPPPTRSLFLSLILRGELLFPPTNVSVVVFGRIGINDVTRVMLSQQYEIWMFHGDGQLTPINFPLKLSGDAIADLEPNISSKPNPTHKWRCIVVG